MTTEHMFGIPSWDMVTAIDRTYAVCLCSESEASDFDPSGDGLSPSFAMAKTFHEIRDPIHNFIRLDSHERKVLDSRPFQRLRHIHQLALTYLLYPGATHRRFEHCLGVMDLAGRVFDVITDREHVTDAVRDLVPEINNADERAYWRRVVRMAALCHDVGHLPFSHAAEKELLPEGWSHERIGREIILGPEMQGIWSKMRPPLNPEDIVKLALGHYKAKDMTFSNWEAILSEIIVGDVLGVDRMDYLLRDSAHIGVQYGRFDHHRLIDTLRILPWDVPEEGKEGTVKKKSELGEPALGVDQGGLQAAEGLIQARYFMYSQVYIHPIRRIHDKHLQEFLTAWLPGGKFSTEVEAHLNMTDNEPLSAITNAAREHSAPGHSVAKRICQRSHFRVLYLRQPVDLKVNPKPGAAIYEAAKAEFGEENIRHDSYTARGGLPDFPIRTADKRIVRALAQSPTLSNMPVVVADNVYIVPEKRKQAELWLKENQMKIIENGEQEIA